MQRYKLNLSIIAILILTGMNVREPLVALPLPDAPLETSHTLAPAFFDPLDAFDANRWHKADWGNPNPPFSNYWRPDHIGFTNGQMTIRLDDDPCPAGCGGRPYASGEYRSNTLVGYGRISARLKATNVPGTVTALFLYTGPPDSLHNEIDIEILGKNPQVMQVNYFTDGDVEHATSIPLWFDASLDFHTYAIEWTPRAIRWYVDDSNVHTEDGSAGPLPATPGRIMLNLWACTGVDSWCGTFNYPGSPIEAVYDWVQYYPFDPAAWSAPTMVNGGIGIAQNPAIVADSVGQVHLAWQRNWGSIQVSARDLDGVWIAPLQLSPAGHDARYPALGADATGGVHAVWADQATASTGSIYYAYRASGGAWTTPISLIANTWLPTYPDVAFDSLGGVHVVWQYGYDGENNLQYAYKPPGGAWQAPSDVWDTPPGAYVPALAIDGNNVLHLIWKQSGTDVAYSTRSLSGSWSAPVVVHHASNSVWRPDIATTGASTLIAAWRQQVGPQQQIFVSERSGGSAWTLPARLSLAQQFIGDGPSLAVAPSGEVLVIWNADANDCVMQRSVAYGWGTPVCIVDLPGPGQPVVTVDRYGVYHAALKGTARYAHSIANTCHTSDVNHDGAVNLADLTLVAGAWNMTGFHPVLDIDGDGRVTVRDVMIVASWWGITC